MNARSIRLRSLLFVPGDRPERMVKALASGADALILDLEDAVAPDRKPYARGEVAAFLRGSSRDVSLFVRVNPLDGGLVDNDLDLVIEACPTGLVLPKAEGAASLIELERRMAMRGDQHGLILPIATETPLSLFRLGEYGGVTERLIGLTWGAEDLPAALGALTARLDDGSYAPPYEIARAMTLFAASAAGVMPIETVYPAIRDLEGVAAHAARGMRGGFVGMMCVHPGQVALVNGAFTPSEAAVAHAHAVVGAFEGNPHAGVLTLDGRMMDLPAPEEGAGASCSALDKTGTKQVPLTNFFALLLLFKKKIIFCSNLEKTHSRQKKLSRLDAAGADWSCRIFRARPCRYAGLTLMHLWTRCLAAGFLNRSRACVAPLRSASAWEGEGAHAFALRVFLLSRVEQGTYESAALVDAARCCFATLPTATPASAWPSAAPNPDACWRQSLPGSPTGSCRRSGGEGHTRYRGSGDCRRGICKSRPACTKIEGSASLRGARPGGQNAR